jgi:hypothetical protein
VKDVEFRAEAATVTPSSMPRLRLARRSGRKLKDAVKNAVDKT